jgi:predicted nucleotidyltransferase
MKQKEIINQLKENITKLSHIDCALLIGSFSRNDYTYNSDVDISVLVNKYFQEDEFLREIHSIFSNNIRYALKSKMRKKCVIYFTDSPKIEFNICNSLGEIDNYFMVPENTSIEDWILLDDKNRLKKHLLRIIRIKQSATIDTVKLFNETLNKFLYDFENLSHYHRRSEPYKSYFQYNLALNDCMQLLLITNQSIEHLYLPKIQNYFFGKDGREKLKSLNGSLNLPEINNQKRILLNFFYEILDNQNFITKEKVKNIKDFCEWIFMKDYGYNFRDISDNCKKIKSGMIFRTSTLTRYQNEEYFETIMKKYSISKIIDLRADREISKDPYLSKTTNILWAPFDPWNQSDNFINNHKQGSDSEIAYRFFAIECKESIRKITKEILNKTNEAIAIHCHAGKDRTGCLISLFYLLCGASEEEIYLDYFASEADTKKYKIDSFLFEVKKYNTIEDYFLSCGLSKSEVTKLKKKLIK